MNFEERHADYLQWVKETFPGETFGDQFNHLIEEIEELRANPEDAGEYADVLMLLFCLADQVGIDIFQAFAHKFEINKNREWVFTEHGYRHKK